MSRNLPQISLAHRANKRLPAWQVSPLPAHHPLHGWLVDSASLTARIAARSSHLRVHVLSQGLAKPHHDEAMLLGLRRDELACVREVLLIADGQAVVYARSLLRRKSLRGAWTIFSGMGTRPLGAALFADPLITRGPLRARRLDRRDTRFHRVARCLPPHADLAGRRALWARRSCFVRHGHPLIVCEVFLPNILELPK